MPPTDPPADERLTQLRAWLDGLRGEFGLTPEELAPASSDASFRRYFRVGSETGRHYVVMDAPPEREAVGPFIAVAELMLSAGVNAPRVLARDEARGFLLLTDLGRQTYLDVLDRENAPRLFDLATDALARWQAISRPGVLPDYDRAELRCELELFPDWYVARHHGLALGPDWRLALDRLFDRLLDRHLAEAKVFVHRDFMPRNLMISDPTPGVLDFQDARYGPVSYDIACLTRDAFISWDEEFVLDITIRYWEKARRAGIPVPTDFGDFWRDVEWMGVQRHLKVLGIFARIRYRDGKPRYLTDAPRFISYLRASASRYDDLAVINRLLDHLEAAPGRPGER